MLETRATAQELMDDPSLDAGVYAQVMRDLGRVNAGEKPEVAVKRPLVHRHGARMHPAVLVMRHEERSADVFDHVPDFAPVVQSV